MKLRKLLFFPPVMLGVIGYISLFHESPSVSPSQAAPVTIAVRALEVQPEDFRFVARGFGRVDAARRWDAISEVEGRVKWMSDNLDVGEIVEGGQELFWIDTVSYEIAVSKAQAQLAVAEADVAQLDREEKNSLATLKWEERNRDLAQQEFNRTKSLVERGTTARVNLDQEEASLLAAETSLQLTKNQLALYSAQRSGLEATATLRRQELAEAKRDLASAQLIAPFTGRVTESNLELELYARVGDNLLTLEATDKAEILVELPLSELVPVLIASLESSGLQESDSFSLDNVLLMPSLDLEARVQIFDTGTVYWPARIDRVRGALDPDTSTFGVFVVVDDPFVTSFSSGRPPLASGAFVSVDLLSPLVRDAIKIPRSAVHFDDDGSRFVYVADTESRLQKRVVSSRPVKDGETVIYRGLDAGDVVVISHPEPPILGAELTLFFEDQQTADGMSN